jgi:soluble lytic murein transglycosylase-like protein
VRKIHGLKRRAVFTGALVVAFYGGSTLAFADGAPQTFEEMVQTLKPTHLVSAKQMRSDVEALNGGTIELQGIVSGVMTRDGARTVLLKLGDGTTLLGVAPQLDAPALRAGTAVRVLARVDAGSKDSPFSVIAAMQVPRDAVKSTPVADNGDSAEIITDADIVTVLPQPPTSFAVSSPAVPATSPTPRRQPRPQTVPLAARGGSTRAPARTTPPGQAPAPLSSSDVEEIIEDQKPAYEAIVRRHNKKLQPAVVEEIAEALLRAGYQYNMDPRFLAAIIAVESDFDVHCLSGSGAMGLGQLMPFNLKEAGVKNPWSPTENIFGTARLLRGHLDDYKDRPNGTLLAVAAYNAGPGAVRRAGYKVPNGAQVQRYVWKVYYRYKAFAPDMF